jgi:hypothetical protein
VRFAAIPHKLYFALLGGIDIQMLKIEPDDMRFGIGFPTLELAGEWYALDWMRVRSAIRGGWGILLAGPPDDNPKYEQMIFSTGVGFPLGPFCLDAVIEYSLWNDGPYFLGGAGAGLFAGVSFSYQWGGGAQARAGAATDSGDSWSTPKAAKPKPVIKPKPKPPPVEEKPAPPPPEEKPKEEKKKDSSFEGWEEE